MGWLPYLIELHRGKDAAYGDAWCRRGEAAGIFPNIARKYDRWARIQSMRNADPGAVEPLDDTLADLAIYAVKYVLWLRERNADVLAWLPPTCLTVDATLSEIADRPITIDPGNELVHAFGRLEAQFVDSGRSSVIASGGAMARARYAWDVASCAWALLQMLPPPPAAASPLPATSPVAASDLDASSSALANDLLDQLLTKLVAQPGTILLLGRTAAALRVRAQLFDLGFGEQILGVADPDVLIADEPWSLGWEEISRHTDYVVVASDADKERLLSRFTKERGGGDGLPTLLLSGMGHLDFRDRDYDWTDAPALVPSYATGYPFTRVHMFQHLQAAAANGLNGAIVEFGAFKGGTSAWLARTARFLGLDSRVYAFDSWDGFPPRRSVLDLYEHPRCIFRDLAAVRAYLDPFGVELVEGDIVVTAEVLEDIPILLGFVDTDNYSPAHAALTAIADNVVPGGAIVFDHFTTTADYLYTLGERMAAREVLATRGFLQIHGSGVFLKLPQGSTPPG
jgi:O-methyltransferase